MKTAIGYTVISICWSRFVSRRLRENKRQMPNAPSLLRHSILLSLSAFSELTEIKMFTGINIAQCLHTKPWCKRVLVWYPLAYLHGLKQKYFQHCDVTNYPTPCIENIPKRDITVSYRTEPWILWTVTPLIYKPDSKKVGTLYKLWIKKECNNLQIS